MNDCVFNKTEYRRIIGSGLRSGYRFIPFSEMEMRADGPSCLLRHDIDADVGAALEMAKIEHDMDVRSTYFFMTRSPVYNLFSRANHSMVHEILRLGHWIGLHYDQGYDPGGHKSESAWIEMESELFEKSFDRKIDAVSFHQPGPAVLQGGVNTGVRLNTYKEPNEYGFTYISDSNRIFREHPAEIMEDKKYPKLQLLIHPIWWIHEDGHTTADVWDRAITANFLRAQDQLLATERAYGSPRVCKLTRSGDDE